MTSERYDAQFQDISRKALTLLKDGGDDLSARLLEAAHLMTLVLAGAAETDDQLLEVSKLHAYGALGALMKAAEARPGVPVTLTFDGEAVQVAYGEAG